MEGRPSAPPPSAIEEFATRKAHHMRITRDFKPMSDRYGFDFGPCSNANGFAQIDTRQDASYYGTWCSPAARTIVNFCEGDVTTTVCETDAEFADQPPRIGQVARRTRLWPHEYRPRIQRYITAGVRETRRRRPVALRAAFDRAAGISVSPLLPR